MDDEYLAKNKFLSCYKRQETTQFFFLKNCSRMFAPEARVQTSAGKGCRLWQEGQGSETAQLSGPAFDQGPACQPLGTCPMITSKHFEIHRCNFLRLKERLYLPAFEVDKELCVVTMDCCFYRPAFRKTAR